MMFDEPNSTITLKDVIPDMLVQKLLALKH